MRKAGKNITRGIITHPCNVEIRDNGNRLTMNKGIKQEDMFFYALYWDKVILSCGILDMGLPCDEEFQKQGVLEKLYCIGYQGPSPYRFQNRIENIAGHELWVFGDVAKQKLLAPGEDWTINHANSEPKYMPEHSKEVNTIRLRISNALPFPSVSEENDVERLLNYKLDRASELAALHDSMDNLIKRVYEEPIHALKEREIKRFENAVNELDRTLIERFQIIQKSDWEIGLNLDPVNMFEKVSAIGAAMVADNATGPYPIFTSIAGLASVLSMSKKYGITFNQYARDDIKLEFISGAKSKKIIP